MDIKGTTAIVTGGGSGIGRATAVALVKAGAEFVHLADLNEQGALETAAMVRAAGGQADVHVLDVADSGKLTDMFDAAAKHGPIDILFNNAGIVTGADLFPDTPVERIERIIAVNIAAVVVGTKLAVKHMAGRGGAVVNTASTTALHTRFRDYLYAMTKTAVLSFTGSCAPLEETQGIRVMAVLPTLIDTPILDTTGGDRRADWMEPVLANNVALAPRDVAAGVLELLRGQGNGGSYLVVDEDWLRQSQQSGVPA